MKDRDLETIDLSDVESVNINAFYIPDDNKRTYCNTIKK